MLEYQDYEREYEKKQATYSLPNLDDLQIHYNISAFAYPPRLILWDVVQCMNHHLTFTSMNLESLIHGQGRLGALYELKHLGKQEREDIHKMWSLIQGKLWLITKSQITKEEHKIARIIQDVHAFWITTYVPFAQRYYTLFEKIWFAQEKRKLEKQPNYYE